jgi:hypothetical protein
MSRIRPLRMSRREQALTHRSAIDGIRYAANRCKDAKLASYIVLKNGPSAATELARRLIRDADIQMSRRSRLRRRGA